MQKLTFKLVKQLFQAINFRKQLIYFVSSNKREFSTSEQQSQPAEQKKILFGFRKPPQKQKTTQTKEYQQQEFQGKQSQDLKFQTTSTEKQFKFGKQHSKDSERSTAKSEKIFKFGQQSKQKQQEQYQDYEQSQQQQQQSSQKQQRYKQQQGKSTAQTQPKTQEKESQKQKQYQPQQSEKKAKMFNFGKQAETKSKPTSTSIQDFQPGNIFSMLSELQKQQQESQQAETQKLEQLNKKILNLEQISNPDNKTLQQMIELYTQLKQYDKVIAIYHQLEPEFLSESVENNFFQATLFTSLEQAKKLIAEHFIPQNKLNLLYRQNIASYLGQIIQKDTIPNIISELDSFYDQITQNQIKIYDLDLKELSKLILDENQGNDSQKLDLINLFMKYLKNILEQQQINNKQVDQLSFSSLKTKRIFSKLNYLYYPNIKFNKQGRDLCETFINTLQQFQLLNEQNLGQLDIAQWLGCYFNSENGLQKLLKICSVIRSEKFIDLVMDQINNFANSQKQLPFSPSQIKKNYEQMKNSANVMNNTMLKLFLELAEVYQEYGIIIDMFENFEQLLGVNKKNSLIYEKLLYILTSISLEQDQKFFETISNTLSDATLEKVQIDKTVQSIIKIQALIKDKEMQQAFDQFQENFIQMNKIEYQRLKIKYFLAALAHQQKIQSEFTVVEIQVSKFLKNLQNQYLEQMYNQECTINSFLKQQTKAKDLDQQIEQILKIKNFQKVKQLLEVNNQTPKQMLDEIKGYENQLQYDELRILNNYDQANKEYHRNYLLQKYNKELYLLELELKALAEYHTANELAALPQQARVKEVKELIRQINGLPDLGSVVSDYQDKELNPHIKSLLDMKLKSEQKYQYLVKLKQINTEVLEKAIFIFDDLYKQVGQVVELQKSNQDRLVLRFILWGVQQKEPLAIYLGEKYCEIINNQIPDYTAIQISNLFSSNEANNKTFMEKQKQALSLVGFIQRDKIYSNNLQLNHIVSNDYLKLLLEKEIGENPTNYNAKFNLFKLNSYIKYVKFGIPQDQLLLSLDKYKLY